MDGVVPAPSKFTSNHKLLTSCYNEKMFSLSSRKNCEKNNYYCSSSDRSCRRRSFNSSLHSIDETESLDFQRSRKRELCVGNVCPEKRLSDPLLHCAFINRGFDVELNHQHITMYHKLFDAFSYLPNCHQSSTGEKSNSFCATPRVKVRISDECGNRIDNSFDSQSDLEVDDCWNFGATEMRDDRQLADAFNIIRNEDTIRPAANKCGKCGHRKPLTMQFSTTF